MSEQRGVGGSRPYIDFDPEDGMSEPEPLSTQSAADEQIERIAALVRTMIGADPKDDRRYGFGDLIRPLVRPSEAAAALYDAGLRAGSAITEAGQRVETNIAAVEEPT